MIPARVSLITIGARDMSTLRAFYGRIGWEETPESDDGFVVFRTGGGVLSLFPIELLAAGAGAAVPPDAGGFKGITLAVNVESAELVDRAMERAREAGARIVAEPEDAEWGGRSGYFVDPEDNYWEIAWAPGTAFDERGGLIWP